MQLPLFPLPVVLFPAALMPLHIFEPRYQALLADCAEGEHRFCLLPPAPDGGTPEIGCTGSIARIRAVQPLTEGRSNIVISGEGRCTLERITTDEKPYLIGEVSVIEDLPDVQVPAPHDVEALLALGERYAAALATINDVEREPDFSDDPATLSFQVAALLEWNVSSKQRFLAVRSATERVARLLHSVPALLGDLESRANVHKRAVHNGTGRPPS